MPYLKIEGYDYVSGRTIDISLAMYVGTNFCWSGASSAGGRTPDIWVSNEDGFVTIFIDDRQYCQRFTISAYAEGMAANPSQYEGWTVVDEPRGGLYPNKAEYRNSFKGRVGINTIDPQTELDLKGTIRAEEIRVETDWADFVFDKDYKLPTLEEVKAHIEEHKHLPGIPSEKEVKENGIGLADMTTKLLQKVEELTLYTIQQQEQLKEQQKINHQLMDEIKKMRK